MTHSEFLPDEYTAALLVNKGLQPRLTPVNDKDYRSILALYDATPDFRTKVHKVASGLGLEVLSVNKDGAFFAPDGPDSIFAYRLGDMPGFAHPESRALAVLIHVTVGALFYPTAEKLNDDSYNAPPVSEAMALTALKSICAEIAEREDKSQLEGIPKELEPGWQSVLVKPETRPEQQRRNNSTLEGLIATVFKQLREKGLLNQLSSPGPVLYTANHRYTVQLREVLVERIFAIGREVVSSEGPNV